MDQHKHRIVIDTIPLLSKLTGIGRYTLEISKRLINMSDTDFTFCYVYYSRKLHVPINAYSGKLIEKTRETLLRHHRVRKVLRVAILSTLKLINKKFDLYWEPAIVPIKHIRSKHLVTTVHDFSFHLYPEWHQRDLMEYMRHNFWKNIQRSDRILTGSHYTKQEIITLLNFDPSKVHVIYHGVDHGNFKKYDAEALQAFKNVRKLPHKFILFVGSIEPRKNLKNSLLAYNSLPRSFKKEHKFVLAGFKGWNNLEVMKIINEERKNIVYLGYLTDQELAYLYNLATIFLYPSLYEGFGLPPLEAMACGTPVVVSRSASLPEVCGDAAHYVDPHDVTNMAEGILTVATDEILKHNMAQKGVARAKSFNWDESAKQHLTVFNEVLNH